MLPDDGEGPDATGDSGSGAGGNVGPMADTTEPVFYAVNHTPQYPGPNTQVNVSAVILDEDTSLNITVRYGFDNKTWKNETSTNLSYGVAEFDNRNPSAGTTGSALSKTYDCGGGLVYLYVNIWSSDSDTMRLRVRGQKAGSSTWTSIYDTSNLRNGGHKWASLESNNYVKFDIYLQDTENNDQIYYNLTYRSKQPKYSAVLPPAKTKNKMYAYFNVSDSSNNTNDSIVLEWSIDRTAPKIKNLTKFTGIYRGQYPAAVNVNLTDNKAAGSAELNWSYDNSTWNLVPMTYVTGFESPMHFRGFIPVPPNNTTVYYRVYGYDQGGNLVKSQNQSFQWNPPPSITDVNHHPYYVNNRTKVKVSAIVDDADNVSKVWVRYSAAGIPWTNLNTTNVGNNYSVEIPAIKGSTFVYYMFYANDTENGTSNSSSSNYQLDETIPKMTAIWKDLSIIGPRDTVDVVGYFRDNNPIINVTLQYSYDQSNWNNLSTSAIPGWLTVDDRQPASGTVTGQTLSKTYTMNGTLKFLYLYVYSSDSDTLTINIEGYNDDTGSWERIYYQNSYSPGTGVRVNNWFTDKNYTSWRISYRDYENNDRIYYNCTYVDDAVGDGATIPPAGTQDMVYYRFNVTDAAYNYLVTDIYEYPIDSTAPTIVNHSIPSVLQRKVAPIPVYANLTDAVYLRSAHLNYSLDNTTWFRVPMTKLSGNTTIGQFRGYLPYPVPSTNTTYYVRVEGYDYPYNLGKTAIHTFGWNPPPWIDTIRLDPEHANNQSYVNITARVTDVDGVDRVYIRYLDGGTIWTRVNATQGTGDNWTAQVPPINNTKWVQYIIYAVDKDSGDNQTVTRKYHIDSVLPTIHPRYTIPAYANASIPIWLMANVTDFVGIDNITLYYRWASSSFTTTTFEQASHRDSLTVAAYLRTENSTYFDSLQRMGVRLGAWNATSSGQCATIPASFWTSADCLMVDGNGSTYDYIGVANAARNGAFVITDRNTFFSARSYVGNPTYTLHRSLTWDTYGMKVGRGAIVYTNDLYNRYYMGYSYARYTNATLNVLAEHLKEAHHKFMPYGALVPKTTTSETVEYRMHVTDLSGLSFLSDIWNYTTDGVNPIIGNTNGPMSPPLIWINQTHTAWVNITDDTYIGGAVVYYSFDNGTNWSMAPLSRVSGSWTDGQWRGSIPAPYTPCYVWYYYSVWDRAGNYVRYPVGSNYAYRATDMPRIVNVTTTPTVISATGSVTITADILDVDGVTGALVAYRRGSDPNETLVNMTKGSGDSWSVTLSNMGATASVYYHITATEALGYTVNSTDRFFFVDADTPVFSNDGWDPTYPNSTLPVTVKGSANDAISSMDVWMEWKYGASGTVNSTYMGTGGQIETTVRNPPTGTTTSTLAANYYPPSGSVIGRVTLRVYADDHAGMYVMLRAYRSGSYTNLFYSSNTDDGIKYDGIVESNNYNRLYVYIYDRYGGSPIYYNLTYTAVSTDYQITIPPPGTSTWVYYRMRGVDQVGNAGNSTWDMYWADGTKPIVAAHKSPGVRDSTSDVTVQATFSDESRMDRAKLFYSYGTKYYWINMTVQFFNGTHLGASAIVPKTSIPLEVDYYFVFFDAAGNNKTSQTYQFTTRMRSLTEGTFAQFDSSVLESEVGISKWEWDFDYNGTFNVDRSGQVVRYRYYDNGTYNVMLTVTLKDGTVTNKTFTINVMDAFPTAGIVEVGTVVEGTNVTLDASYSSSWPDAIVSYEWDLDYDEVTFDVDATGLYYNHTFMFDGSYKVGLRVTDDDGSTALSDIDIVVTDGKPDLQVEFLTSVDEGVVVVYNATDTVSWPDALDRIEWDLDYDGTFNMEVTGLVVNHTYMDDGTYRFAARAYDDDGSMTQLIGTVKVNDLAPVANITAMAMVDEGVPLDLDARASTSFPDAITKYEWDFDYDGTTFDIDDTGNLTNHTYMDDGTYTVALRVWDDDGSATIATWDVTVADLHPHATIIAPLMVDEGALVQMTAAASSFPDDIVRIEWDFVYDGADFIRDTTGVDVEYTYMDNGTYDIAIRVIDDDGSIIMEIVSIDVNDLKPNANATLSGDFQEGNKLILDARPSTSYPDEIVSYEWDLDYDGEEFDVDMTGDVNEYTYMDHGAYTIALRVTDDDGSVDIFTEAFAITDLEPTAAITVTVLFHSEGDLVTFSAGSSTSYPDELVAYHWDWDGDGEVDETTQDENGKHIFNSPGRYEVILTVEDDDKSTDSTSVFVTITDVGPVARLEAVATPEGDPVLLDASGTEEPGSDFVAFRWDLDGDMVWDVEDTCSTLVRTWDEPGMYSITMQVEDEDGSKASKGITLVIQDVAPVADTGGPYEVFEGTPLLLDASGSHEPGRDFTLFRWDLDGDGAFDEEGMELEWTFTLSGEYTISLRVEDEDGSSGEATTTLVVLDKDPEFTIDLPDNVMENVPANFSLVDLYDPGTEVFQVTWHFGDGETANGPTVEHAFPEQGTYRGRVVVEDNDGTVVTVPWPRELPVANSPPVVELSTLVLKATEDSQFTISVFGHDTANDTVTYDFKGPGGKIDEQTGVFKWTPLDEHVGKNKFTFIAVDEDGGEGVLEVEIDVKDVDNDFPGGLPFATGMAIVIVIILAAVGAFIIVGRQRKKAEAEVIEAEDKVDLKAQVEVDLDEAAAPEAAPELEDVPPVAPAVTEAPPAKPPRKRPPEGRPPPKKRPPGAPPPKKRPPGQRPPPKKRPPGAPPPKKRPPGQRPPPKKRPPGAPPPKKRPPGAPPRKRPPGAPPPKKRPPGAPPRKKRPPGAPPPKRRPPPGKRPPPKKKKRPPAP